MCQSMKIPRNCWTLSSIEICYLLEFRPISQKKDLTDIYDYGLFKECISLEFFLLIHDDDFQLSLKENRIYFPSLAIDVFLGK